MALGLYDGLERDDPVGRLHAQIEAMKLAFADAHRYVFDGPLPPFLLDPGQLSARRALDLERRDRRSRLRAPCRIRTRPTSVPSTADGTAISLSRACTNSFGSGVARGQHGRRAAEPPSGFSPDAGPPELHRARQATVPHDHPGDAARGRQAARPVRRHGRPDAAAGHISSSSRIVGRRRRPAGALDCGRFRVAGGPGGRARAGSLAVRRRPAGARPRSPVLDEDVHPFGVGQAILGSAMRSSAAPTRGATGSRSGLA